MSPGLESARVRRRPRRVVALGSQLLQARRGVSALECAAMEGESPVSASSASACELAP